MLAVLLGVTLVLVSAAALAQASGPDGAEGRRLRRIHQAGAVSSALPIVLLRSEPRRIATVNRKAVYRTTVDLSVPFADGPRTLALDVETAGPARVGAEVTVEYAPGAPALGAQPHAYATVSGLALPWFLGLAFAGLVVVPVVLADGRRRVHEARRFRPAVHLPAAGILLVGAGLAAYVGPALPSPFVGWPLAVVAAATPWLALGLGAARTGPGLTASGARPAAAACARGRSLVDRSPLPSLVLPADRQGAPGTALLRLCRSVHVREGWTGSSLGHHEWGPPGPPGRSPGCSTSAATASPARRLSRPPPSSASVLGSGSASYAPGGDQAGSRA
ncbi:hypothetical protein ACIQI7_16680 [Kitasatospora sp. NPDC092039]|uniref:hypothetical protein n=1 Tax=Kitasatospora sp. NPDC092039 TaxID=3364086 RepID=UPI003815EC59